jgi:imidazole glycerol-phosphate synthase subunit HisH
MKIAIVKYNAGNVVSVANALSRLGAEAVISDDAAVIASADKVIFPGVGEASTAMNYLRQQGLDAVIRNLKQPVLAICLGMQLMAEYSDENGTECLGILPTQVRRFPAGDLKVPHIGWNNIRGLDSPLFTGVPEDSRVYFVHGYFVEKGDATIAATSYGVEFSAGVRKDNFIGVQFHPEKSGKVGATMLENFLKM